MSGLASTTLEPATYECVRNDQYDTGGEKNHHEMQVRAFEDLLTPSV